MLVRLSGLLAAVAVIGPLSPVPAAPHADAQKRIDFVVGWGANFYGELGDGATRRRKLPVTVRLPQGVTVKAISAGEDNGLALTSTGRLLAWGGTTGFTPTAIGAGIVASTALAIGNAVPA